MELAEDIQDWQRDPVTQKLARRALKERDELLTQMMCAALASSDANVRGQAMRLNAANELVELLGGDRVRE